MQVFEDVFSDAQTEMIGVAMEYADNSVEAIYIFVAIVNTVVFAQALFVKGGNLYEQHVLPGVDTSGKRQQDSMDYVASQAERIIQAGETYHRTVPSEYRLRYDAKANSLAAKYQTGEVYDMTKTFPLDGFEDWEKEIAAGLNA
ncbi:MAG: hypothetical protein FWF36_08180 [Propionibacteriaceae bacterium]|nr:hypothetical protein [Propionibacteriaceae bacterium]